MPHFAEIDANNTVIRVIVADDISWPKKNLGGRWVQTSYRTRGGDHPEGKPLRKNYAGIGFKYDETRDAFVPPKPYRSWKLNERAALWEAPKAYPSDGKLYRWDEDKLDWIEGSGA